MQVLPLTAPRLSGRGAGLVIALCVLLAAVMPASAQTTASDVVSRVAGEGRVGTAVQLSGLGFPEGASRAVLARAGEFPDALAAAALAAEVGGPVLLTGSERLDAATGQELRRLGVDLVYLVGGVGALSGQVEADAAALGVDTSRLAGGDRFGTAAAVAREVVALGGPVDRVVVARADAFADALAAGNLAAAGRAPILLTSADEVPDPTMRALDEVLSGEDVVVAGGTAAVGAGAESQLTGAGYTVSRVAGADRYATAVALVEEAVRLGAAREPTLLASGGDFPDALAAGPVAHSLGGTLLLVDPVDVAGSPVVGDYLGRHAGAVDTAFLAGGPAAVSDTVAAQVLDFIADPADDSDGDGSDEDGDGDDDSGGDDRPDSGNEGDDDGPGDDGSEDDGGDNGDEGGSEGEDSDGSDDGDGDGAEDDGGAGEDTDAGRPSIQSGQGRDSVSVPSLTIDRTVLVYDEPVTCPFEESNGGDGDASQFTFTDADGAETTAIQVFCDRNRDPEEMSREITVDFPGDTFEGDEEGTVTYTESQEESTRVRDLDGNDAVSPDSVAITISENDPEGEGPSNPDGPRIESAMGSVNQTGLTEDFVDAFYDRAIDDCEGFAPEQFTYTDSDSDEVVAVRLECDRDADQLVVRFPFGTLDNEGSAGEDGTLTYTQSATESERVRGADGQFAVSPQDITVDCCWRVL